MSVAFHRSPKDWLMSNSILDQAAKAIREDVKVVYDFDIPYVAGYSKDGKTFYIDRLLPRRMRNFDVSLTLLVHEAVERGLEGEIKSLPYQLAHQIALRAERACVEAANISWAEYNSWFNVQIKKIGGRDSYPNCPPDLDLEPYYDEEDWQMLKKMQADGRALWNGKKTHPDVK